MKKFVALLIAVLFALGAVACGGSGNPSSPSGSDPSSSEPSAERQTLTVAASPAPHAEILEHVKPILAEQGIDLVIREFTDYVQPNNVVFSGDLDANYFQHQPYLTQFNTDNNTDLISAGSIHFEPLGIYPGKSTSLEDVPVGAVIGVPNDTTNEARALNLLVAQGLITLKEGVGLNATPNDIVDNPKELVIREFEAAQVPVILPDLDFGVINGNYAVGAGIIDTVLVTESSDSQGAQEFANIVAVKPDMKDDPRILALVAALTSEDTRTFIQDKYGVAVVPVF